MKLINFILLSGLMLGGCGGTQDPIDDEDDTTPEPPKIDYSQLKNTPQTDAALVIATESSLDNHIKNGIRLQLVSSYPPPGSGGGFSSSGIWFSSSSNSSSSSSSSSSGSSNGSNSSSGSTGSNSSSGGLGEPTGPGYTDTNVHVAGVDEADYAKYDGHHWYVATRPQYRDYFIADEPGIQIAATDPATAGLEVVGHITLEPEWGTINEMYLVQDDGDTTHLAVIRKQAGYRVSSSSGGFWGSTGSTSSTGSTGSTSSSSSSSSSSSGEFVAFAAVSASSAASTAASSSSSVISSSSSSSGSFPYPDYYYQVKNGQIRIQLIDVENPAQPEQDWAITMDGEFVDSRRIGDVLYLVTRFDPWVPGLQPGYLDDATNSANEQILASTPVTALLPHYDLGNGKKPLTTNCYIQADVRQEMGNAEILNITAIDLKDQKLIGSQCMNGSADTLSMSLESLYLTGTVYLGNTKTVIHKFSLGEDGPAYEASGSVEGHILGGSDPAFRLHEHEGDLRIVTTTWDFGPVHQLFILGQSGNELDVVAQLPNSAQPAPIGKPGEDIYSVRFEAERAYIVTFRNTDPLYAIDLSDRLAPKILGELEIPGFATYMHPLNSRYLFTFGRNTDESGRITGLKAELIDVADGAPKTVSTILLGGRDTGSEALNNLKALSLLEVSENEWRIALPINYYEPVEGFYHGPWQYNGLQLLSATGLAGDSAQLENAGVLKTERADQYFQGGSTFSRSVLHDDAVFLAHNNAFWSANWNAPEQAEGPKAKQLVTCPDQPEPGVHVFYYNSDTENACSANITLTDGDYSEILVPQATDPSNTACSYEGAHGRPGSYTLKVTRPGYASILMMIQAAPSRCGAHTAYLRLSMEPEESCGDSLGESVVAYLYSADGNADIPSCDATVVFEQNDMSYPLQKVFEDSDGKTCHFTGRDGIFGEGVVKVNLPGYREYRENIFVTKGGCYVDTQYVGVNLEPEL